MDWPAAVGPSLCAPDEREEQQQQPSHAPSERCKTAETEGGHDAAPAVPPFPAQRAQGPGQSVPAQESARVERAQAAPYCRQPALGSWRTETTR